ncbi:transcriptional regulator BetI [Bacterioplanoides sp. SCSIO 12839]|uniref:transcriptional regulator BetI n=1 Tax=Bacterioplanoides sp. SCSIO 12839 TaxID=2829569 RepID=UPI0021023240|nr:transcriptional regulator BetI [Bacterioplanoides sp. SCSIO 12839]UTW48744.1 transcriptional regulator BetI [Bacterioplanoides sp. SCSIO 12839]
MSRSKQQSQRRDDIVQATLKSIELYGLSGTTIKTISGIADISVGLINHHFGSKQKLLESAVRFLLEQLRLGLQQRLQSDGAIPPKERLYRIVETNFTSFQQSPSASRTWLCFWAEAAHCAELSRLQQINSRRLYSNLLYSFVALMPREDALVAAERTASMIDGFWLRSTLSSTPEQAFVAAEQHCKAFIDELLDRQ